MCPDVRPRNCERVGSVFVVPGIAEADRVRSIRFIRRIAAGFDFLSRIATATGAQLLRRALKALVTILPHTM
jgi:hypothetical protein